MRNQSSSIRNVLVVLRMTGASGREFFGGILKYAHAPRHWNIRLLNDPSQFTPEAVKHLREEGIDGILASEFGTDATRRALECSDIPLVVLGSSITRFSRRKRHIGFVLIDDKAIGRAGAGHFLECGNYASYAFAQGAPGWFWSEERFASFQNELKAHRKNAHRLRPDGVPGSRADIDSLAARLQRVSKPCAVMADYDYRAIQVLEACRQANLTVPRDVAVLGVDNDELLCDFSDPPLTSILPDHEQAAYRAADMLDRLMSGRNRKDAPIVRVGIKRTVRRESTAPTTPAAHIIREALAYIDRHAAEGLRVKDVVRHLGISRRLLDLRFSQFAGKTLNRTIESARLEAVRRELTTTNHPIVLIAENCGFANVRSLQNLFKRKYDRTMTDYRRDASSTTLRTSAATCSACIRQAGGS